MSPGDWGAVAVMNGDAEMMAIWHVAAEPVVQTPRLCGAWVTDDLDVQRKVVAARKVVLLDDDRSDRVKVLLTHAWGVIDLDETLIAIERYVDSLDEIHQASLTPKGNKRAPISWPALYRVPGKNALPAVPVGVVEDPLICSTIAMAGWLAGLAEAWSATEAIRTSKPHLSVGSPSALPPPFVVTNQ